ncbi:MAG: tryptophan halogenase family protein [Paraglaciecola sp.]|uniref:tryptophan halogenase family protein n=1 Tax=Paraglaciecola sp. TaxID=1920173 RepID=UPI003296EE2E
MSQSITQVVIVGGGTAGWITAGTLASTLIKKYGDNNPVTISLIESSDIASIGVGEGTWPTMRNTLRNMGISETDLIRECNATFKQGSTFKGWKNGSTNDIYQHPFSLPQDFITLNMADYWQHHQQSTFADIVTPQSAVCRQGLAPKQAATPEYAAVCNYGYHLDAGAFAEFIKKHCINHLQVNHIVDTVVAIEPHINGDIKAIRTEKNGDIKGHLFIDCSGMAALLIGQHYGVAYNTQHQYLFNDSAIAAHIPYPEGNSPIASTTLSSAQENGWIWDIGLQTRRGTGYVYSSEHSSEVQAQECLRTYLNRNGQNEAETSIKKITFTPGYRQKFWTHNCVAIGLSSGFVEPLEASSLALVELSAAMLSDQFPTCTAAIPLLAKRFNQRFSYRWQRIIDFLKLHYVLSQRNDSAYWIDNRTTDSIPDSLQALLELWKFQTPWHYDFERTEVFPAASYQYILCGMGYSRSLPNHPISSRVQQQAQQNIQQVQNLTRQYLTALPSHRGLINDLIV